jgi:hypothetical protein
MTRRPQIPAEISTPFMTRPLRHEWASAGCPIFDAKRLRWAIFAEAKIPTQ